MITLKITSLNALKVLVCDIQYAYLTAKFREKIWTMVRPEFGPEQGKFMRVLRELYGLKFSRAAFRYLLD